MKEFEPFLKSVESFNSNYCSIKEGEDWVSLTSNFWSWDDIQKNLKMREEWNVSEAYIPFYGDWHNLYCIDCRSHKVVSLNDERHIVCEWPSREAFEKSLSEKELNSLVKTVVEAKLDF